MQRRTVLGAAAAATALALARPSLAKPARVLRFVPQANLSSPDPIWTTSDPVRNHAYLIYDTLYGVDTQLTPSPQMCAGHELSADGLAWRFTLRDGLKFHDGEPVRAIDCTTSIIRWSKRDGFGQVLASRPRQHDNPGRQAVRASDQQALPTDAARARRQPPASSCRSAWPRPTPSSPSTASLAAAPSASSPTNGSAGRRSSTPATPTMYPGAGAPSFSAGAKVVNLDRVGVADHSRPSNRRRGAASR